MSGDIARWDLRLRRRSTLAYSVGVGVYAVLIVVLYPTFEHDTSLDQLTSGSSTVSALFGATGSLTTSSGWMNANLYANFVPLFALFMTVGYGATAIAGQDEDGTLGGLAALPLTRSRLLAEKVAALGLLSLPIPVVTLAAALAGRSFDVRLDSSALVGTTIGVALLALDFGLLALMLGAWTGRRGTALGVSRGLRRGGLRGQCAGPGGRLDARRPVHLPVLLERGRQPASDAVLVLGVRSRSCIVALALAALAFRGFRRMDIR